MTQRKDFDTNEERINQPASLEENIQEQTNLITNEPQRQKFKVMLFGSPEVINSAIHYFHLIRYAEVGDWSPLEPNPSNPEEMMSILVRYIMVQ